jgi:cation diffusion facilitator CzcD-associated flavoprotein CzcO
VSHAFHTFATQQSLIVYSGLITAARLKALGVDSVVIDRNAHVGDNWTQRYDCLRFHVPTSNCEMPYTCKLYTVHAYLGYELTPNYRLDYAKELQSPHKLTKYDLSEHLKQYTAKFHLKTVLSTTIQSAIYNTSEKVWTIRLKTKNESGIRTVMSRHLVQATGLGSGKPHLPPMEDNHLYKGLAVHSAHYRNAQMMAEQGVKVCLAEGNLFQLI